MVIKKTAVDYATLRDAGRKLNDIFLALPEKLTDGTTASVIDRFIHKQIEDAGAIPSFLGYRGYKYASCISRNEEVVHGLPVPDKVVMPGDIWGIDIGLCLNGWHVDAARTFKIGLVKPEVDRLVSVTEQAFFEALPVMRPGNRVGDIGDAIQRYVEGHGFSVVRDLCSHGVGRKLHEDPLVPNFGNRGSGALLSAGMTLAIEPMVNAGHFDVLTSSDKWTIITRDRSWSAHYENTVLILEESIEILTLPEHYVK